MMNIFDTIERAFGLGRLPWVIRVYILILVVFAGLLIFSVVQTSAVAAPAESNLAVKLFGLAADGLKTVLGALIGSLSLAGERYWGRGQDEQSQVASAQAELARRPE